MTMNSSGPISLAGTTAGQSIEIENGGNGTTQISLNDAAVRALAGVPSGAITMPTNFYGKSNRASISYTFSSNTSNASLNVSSIGGYVSGKSDITVTVNSGVYLYATSTGNYGLNLTGATTGDTISLVNNGYIMGQGGTGANSTCSGLSLYPQSGGPALNVGTGIGITITNASGYIGGGGGGGAGGGTPCACYWGIGGGGGGAGAGRGGTRSNCAGATNNGGAGGSPGGSGSRGGGNNCGGWGGGGGGRILPGSGGSAGGINCNNAGYGGGAGGGGAGNTSGSGGSAGGAGGNANYVGGGGGGGWGATGGSGGAGGGGGGASGGKAINKNGKTVTFASGCGRVYGAIS